MISSFHAVFGLRQRDKSAKVIDYNNQVIRVREYLIFLGIPSLMFFLLSFSPLSPFCLGEMLFHYELQDSSIHDLLMCEDVPLQFFSIQPYALDMYLARFLVACFDDKVLSSCQM